MTLRPLLAAALLVAPATTAAAPPAPEQPAEAAPDRLAMEIAEGLTTEVGERLAATPQEARARQWAAAKLSALGFANVHIEPFTMRGWVRGAEQAEVVGPFPQRLQVTALGHSGATPPQGITAPVVYFPTIYALQDAPAGSLKGKIAFVSHAMKAAQDGGGYGPFGQARRIGPRIAAQKGAVAIVIRSVGTDNHRLPHTGVTGWDGQTPIPAGALSIPDADQLVRIFARGRPVTMHLTLTPRFTGEQPSGNVIADVPGTDPAAGIVLIACHLDSWDLGSGAIDNASGCGIITAAARQVMKQGHPRRTIRLLWAGAEEVGGFGGIAYAKAHAGERHVAAMESDFGADRVYAAKVSTADAAAKPIIDRLARALAPLGIPVRNGGANGGEDVSATIRAQNPAVVDLAQDGTRYFDIHHTADDTLDKIDPTQLAQNVAAWTATLSVLANAEEPLAGPPGPAARQ